MTAPLKFHYFLLDFQRFCYQMKAIYVFSTMQKKKLLKKSQFLTKIQLFKWSDDVTISNLPVSARKSRIFQKRQKKVQNARIHYKIISMVKTHQNQAFWCLQGHFLRKKTSLFRQVDANNPPPCDYFDTELQPYL